MPHPMYNQEFQGQLDLEQALLMMPHGMISMVNQPGMPLLQLFQPQEQVRKSHVVHQ